jgi:hypothetical protein
MNGTEERRLDGRLAWAVWFSQEPLDQEWRWIRVRDELTPGFFQLREGSQDLRELAMIGFPGMDASRQEVVRDLQREVRAVLETAVDQREGDPSESSSQPHSVSIRGKARVTLQVVASKPRGSPSYLWITGSTKEVFLTMLMVELCQQSRSLVRRCGAPSSTTMESERCPRLFVAVGRQLYCTPACTARAMKARQRSGARRPKKRKT